LRNQLAVFLCPQPVAKSKHTVFRVVICAPRNGPLRPCRSGGVVRRELADTTLDGGRTIRIGPLVGMT